MKKIARRVLAALACASALLVPAMAQAITTWTVQVLESGTLPPGVSFNGRRTTNSSGTGILDVPLGTLGLLHETIEPVAINDDGWVISNVYGVVNEQMWIDKDPIYPLPAITVGGVMTQLPFSGSKGGRVVAINNSGFVLINGIGPFPGTWPYDIPGSFWSGQVWASPVEYFDINDAGQILAYGHVVEVGSTTAREAAMILTPVPEPQSAALAVAALALLAGMGRMRRVLPRLATARRLAAPSEAKGRRIQAS